MCSKPIQEVEIRYKQKDVMFIVKRFVKFTFTE